MTAQKPLRARPKIREWIIIATGTIAAVALLIYAVSTMGTRVRGGWADGVIEEKQYTPGEPETQITIGSGGVSSRKIEGEYKFVVRGVSDGKIYTVWVDKPEYDARSVGDRFRFIRPKAAPDRPD